MIILLIKSRLRFQLLLKDPPRNMIPRFPIKRVATKQLLLPSISLFLFVFIRFAIVNHNTFYFYSLRNDLSTPELDCKHSNNFRSNSALFQPTTNSNGTWTLPSTIFTSHIEKLVKHFNSKCYNNALLQPNINIFANSSSSIPVVTAINNNHLVRSNYRIVL